MAQLSFSFVGYSDHTLVDADLNDEQQKKIFGENLRRIAAPILRDKGVE